MKLSPCNAAELIINVFFFFFYVSPDCYYTQTHAHTHTRAHTRLHKRTHSAVRVSVNKTAIIQLINNLIKVLRHVSRA